MKYLKLFEIRDDTTKSKNLFYSFGDYVYVDHSKNTCEFKSKRSDELEPYGVIKMSNGKLFDRVWDYQVECYNYKKGRFEWDYVLENAITRRLTPEEIEQYKAKKDAEKYNI